MEVAVIDGGNQAFNAVLYGAPDPNTLNFLEQSMNQFYNRVGEVANTFLDAAHNLYQKYNDSSVIQATKALLNNISGTIDPYTIYEVKEENWNSINPIMQRYVMVQPEVFDLNQKQSCNAFEDIYLNVDPNAKTYKDHIDYNRLMDGMLQHDEEVEDGFIESITDNMVDIIPELDTFDQVNILNTWNTVETMLLRGIDPTDKDLEEL